MSDIAHTLSREAEAARTLLLNIKDVIGDDETASADAIEGQTNLKEACEAAAQRLVDIESLSTAIEEQAERLAARRSRLQRQSESIRAALAAALGMAEQTKIETAVATISLRSVPPKVIVTDEASIPPEYWKRGDPKLDRKSLLAALKEGEVPGATLSNGGQTIAIKEG
jgi:hypothetical protein